MNKLLPVCSLFFFFLVFSSTAQQKKDSLTVLWKEIPEQNVNRTGDRWVIPQKYKLVEMDVSAVKKLLTSAPLEFTIESKSSPRIMYLPLPDGSMSSFSVVESPVMEQGLAQQFPGIKTYAAKGIDDPHATARLDWTLFGFHAMILSPNGAVFIDPYCRGNISQYVVYYKSDYFNAEKSQWQCGEIINYRNPAEEELRMMAGTCVGATLRRYRAAISCTVEYTNFYGGTVAGAMSGIVTSMNRVGGVYETEVAIRLMLVSNNANIVYAGTDPYTGNNNAGVLISESQSNITAVIGSANFDIGHTFSTGAGGLAALGVVCSNSNKARGVTGSSSPVGDPYDIDYVAHEIGHQFGGNHTFNGTTSSCGGGNRNASTAYETGSGTTIQAYAGICGSDNIQPNSDPYFHNISYVEIVNFSNTGGGNSCAFFISTGNNAPNPNAGINYSIPVSTPFTLTGTSTDPDGDPLTYCWEEMDLGAGGAWNVSTGTAPLFKPRIPKTVSARTFPDMAVILAGYPAAPAATMGGLKGETLPSTARTMRFRMTVRDNRTGGGGVCWDSMTVSVVNNGGAFTVTSPNTSGINWLGGSSQIITWNVSGTTNSPVSCPLVDILMSADGGNTFPTVLASGVPNDGSQNITTPNIATNSNIRIKIVCSNNIFFDISNFNHTIIFNSTLPITLLKFFATGNKNFIRLSWSTASEMNNKGFELQRSENDQKSFAFIQWIDGKINSNVVNTYYYDDYSVSTGQTYYYRLKQVDVNGDFTYSPIVSGRLTDSPFFSMSVQPVPSSGTVSVFIFGMTVPHTTLTVSDKMGKTIFINKYSGEYPSHEFSLDLYELSSGIYFVRAVNGEKSAIEKIVKL